LLNGLIKPDTGTINLHGRVGALIALGAGFNPILTGRENVYISASVMGIQKKKIDELLSDIISFSELDSFIDSPVQTYSSGMQTRLGFSVAIALKPDILFIDEVLSVGDRYFRAKCLREISKIKEKAAIILVSHDESMISMNCNRGMLLVNGASEGKDETKKAISKYLSSRTSANSQTGATIIDELSINHFSPSCPLITFEHSRLWVIYELEINFIKPVKPELLTITLEEESLALAAQSIPANAIPKKLIGRHKLLFKLDITCLRPGNYYVSTFMGQSPANKLVYNAIHFGTIAKQGEHPPLFTCFNPSSSVQEKQIIQA
jgi:lipopolysaccharide transport system ATP-binding protein